ncbi:hypothetical protein ACFLXO_00375 [Chloroflexota bacterium]
MERGSETEFSCIDPNGIVISCSEQSWTHLTKHNEMIGQQGIIKAVLESPDFINRDANHKKWNNYYKLLVLPQIGSTYVRVTVQRPRLIGRKRGYVITGHACNGEKKGEVRLWSKK